MNHSVLNISCNSSRIDKWDALESAGASQAWLPCMIDAVLNADGDETIFDFTHSRRFLEYIQSRLDKYEDFYVDRGLNPKTLTHEQLFNDVLLEVFADVFVCKLQSSKKLNLNSHPGLATEEGRKEIQSICLHEILKKIPSFKPEKGGFEAFLFMFAYTDARRVLLREMRSQFATVSLDRSCHDEAAQSASLLDMMPAEIRDSVGVDDTEIDIDDIRGRLFLALRFALNKPERWETFCDVVFRKQTLDEIAEAKKIYKSAVSQRFDTIQYRFSGELSGKKSKVHLTTFSDAIRNCLSEEEFLQRVPKPVDKANTSSRSLR